nr:CDK-activating kinase assembly factor MAT1 [Ciona intestinalis]|eukprot:XP_002127882.1 CDK-activating kinase assembly factor MAT1 [Ciona intestinalis]
MDELSCPRCRMTKYRNPSLRLLINTCGHALCEACVELTFTRESAPCPECGRTLRKIGFRVQLFEDTQVDKEVDIRKSVLKIYNKQESDFTNLDDYNDYLEEIENIVFNLESGINEKETREKMAEYKKENETIIRKNQIYLHQQRKFFKEAMEQEEREKQLRAIMQNKLDQETESNRKRNHEELIKDLTTNTNMSSKEVLEKHKRLKLNEEQSRLVKESLKEKIAVGGFNNLVSGSNVNSIPPPAVEMPSSAYVFQPLVIELFGPEMPNKQKMLDLGYMGHVRQATSRDIGGGYGSLLTCKKALNEAFSGLFFNPESIASQVM